MFVGWRTAGQRTVSRADSVGMGGIFLYTPDPPSPGSVIELLFDLKSGEVRARGIVRHSHPGRGMGVQFVQMQPADRARLNKFLSQFSAESQTTGPTKKPSVKTATGPSAQAPGDSTFERELRELLELARNGTHYQLLGISPDSSDKQIKRNFYAFAQKFHPDHHMEKKEYLEPLKQLMATVTDAYKTLSDDEKRSGYDAQLASTGAYSLRRVKSASQETLEECFAHANELLRAHNFVGSVVWLRKCVELAPDSAKYHKLLARSLGTIPQYRSEAIEQFSLAIELDPLDATVYVHLAELYEEMQQPWRAKSLYSKILEIDPLHAQARERLSELGVKEEKA